MQREREFNLKTTESDLKKLKNGLKRKRKKWQRFLSEQSP